MIAAVLEVGAPGSAAARLRELAICTGKPALETKSFGRVTLARWGGPVATRVDLAQHAFILGSARALSNDQRDLKGDFALVRETGGDLELVCGRFLGRPLFYARDDEAGLLMACSRLAPLVQTLRRPWQLDEGKVAALAFGLSPPDTTRTPYIGVARVPPGTTLRLSRSGAPSLRLRSLAPESIGSAASADDWARALRERIFEVLSREIVGRAAVTLASGGLDSSMVLALAVEAARASGSSPVAALTLDDGVGSDDHKALRALADALVLEPIRLAPKATAHYLLSTLVHDGAPTVWPLFGANVALHARARSLGAELVITGCGGDELFDGVVRSFAASARRGDVRAAINGALRMRLPRPMAAPARLFEMILRPLVRPMIPQRLRHGRLRRRFVSRFPWIGQRGRRLLDELLNVDQPSAEDEAENVASLVSCASLAGTSNGRAAIEWLAGTTECDPLYDDDVAALAAAIPSEIMLRDGWVRGLFRHAMPAVVPDAVRWRPGKGPMVALFARTLDAAHASEKLLPLASLTHLADMGLVEPNAYAACFERAFASPKRAQWLPLWLPLSVEAFLRNPFNEVQILGSGQPSCGGVSETHVSVSGKTHA